MLCFLFLLLSAVDLGLILLLGLDCEGNPLASAVWQHYGIAGVIAYKGWLTAIAIVTLSWLRQHREDLGWWLAAGACLLMALLGLYSLALLVIYRL